jgi:hypothetical protein
MLESCQEYLATDGIVQTRRFNRLRPAARVYLRMVLESICSSVY